MASNLVVDNATHHKKKRVNTPQEKPALACFYLAYALVEKIEIEKMALISIQISIALVDNLKG